MAMPSWVLLLSQASGRLRLIVSDCEAEMFSSCTFWPRCGSLSLSFYSPVDPDERYYSRASLKGDGGAKKFFHFTRFGNLPSPFPP
jgi:hypothetical protein